MKNNKVDLKKLCFAAVFTAMFCVLAPISIPVGPVPVTMLSMFVFFTICVLDYKHALLSYMTYLVLGGIGLPVFSMYQGGFHKLTGPTGGYLFGYIITIVFVGLLKNKSTNKFFKIAIMIFGQIIDYLIGSLWFMLIMNSNIIYTLTVCVLPFVVFDILKIVIASILSKLLTKKMTV